MTLGVRFLLDWRNVRARRPHDLPPEPDGAVMTNETLRPQTSHGRSLVSRRQRNAPNGGAWLRVRYAGKVDLRKRAAPNGVSNRITMPGARTMDRSFRRTNWRILTCRRAFYASPEHPRRTTAPGRGGASSIGADAKVDSPRWR
jgi:hypothetical protein